MKPPWDKLQEEVFVDQPFGEGLAQLVGLREMLMLGLYKGEEQSRRFLRYVETFSRQKAVDYQVLIAELRARGELSAGEIEILKTAEARLIKMQTGAPE